MPSTHITERGSRITTNLNNASISQSGGDVNSKFSLKRNTSEEQTRSEQFKKWFGDWENSPNTASKVVNDDGTPKVVYHGTSNGCFTEFDTYSYFGKYGLFGNGIYFTENNGIAGEYTRKGKGENAKIYEVYLNIKNPIDMDAKADVNIWNKILKDGDYYERAVHGETNEQVFRKTEEELSDAYIPKYEVEEIVREFFEEMGYDGITHMGGGRVNQNGEKHRVWIAFYPEQIKSATDNIGTFDGSNPDIRFSLKRNLPTEAEARRAQNREDIKEYGISVNKLVKDIFDETGIQKNRRNEADEESVRNALRTLKDGNEKAAFDELSDTFKDLYKKSRAAL